MHGMYAFSESAGKWVPQTDHQRTPLCVPRLRVATYNVWFDPFEAERRCAAVLDILQGEQPDIIALEEVTQPFLDGVLRTSWVRAQYRLSLDHVEPAQRYEVLMLSRLPVMRFRAHPLTSIMGRKLHTVELETTTGLVSVGGIHLESMREMTPTRLTQIDECVPLFEQAQTAIWLGDFNAAPESEEDTRIRAHFCDTWDEVGGGAPGYTRDTTQNSMLAKVKNDRHQRIDRIFVRSERLLPTAIRLLGTAPLEGTAGQVFPSDHFGLVADFATPESATMPDDGMVDAAS